MCQCSSASLSMRQASGQVLAEAVVVMLLLVVLLGAVHVSGLWQYQWLKQWLAAQTAAQAAALEHARLPSQAQAKRADTSRWHKSAMREFNVAQPNWKAVTTSGRFAQTAWRLSGAGQASLDQTVTDRIKSAPWLWRKTELASKAMVYSLMPTIAAVEMPWEDRGSATEWFANWQGTTPSDYLRVAPR